MKGIVALSLVLLLCASMAFAAEKKSLIDKNTPEGQNMLQFLANEKNALKKRNRPEQALLSEYAQCVAYAVRKAQCLESANAEAAGRYDDSADVFYALGVELAGEDAVSEQLHAEAKKMGTAFTDCKRVGTLDKWYGTLYTTKNESFLQFMKTQR